MERVMDSLFHGDHSPTCLVNVDVQLVLILGGRLRVLVISPFGIASLRKVQLAALVHHDFFVFGCGADPVSIAPGQQCAESLD
jgi:hypothetical protein